MFQLPPRRMGGPPSGNVAIDLKRKNSRRKVVTCSDSKKYGPQEADGANEWALRKGERNKSQTKSNTHIHLKGGETQKSCSAPHINPPKQPAAGSESYQHLVGQVRFLPPKVFSSVDKKLQQLVCFVSIRPTLVAGGGTTEDVRADDRQQFAFRVNLILAF